MLFRTWEDTTEWPAVGEATDPSGVTHTVVTAHALIRRVLADPQTFRPDNALDAVTPIPVSAMRILAAGRFRLPATLANNGGLSHPGIREIVSRALSPARVEAARPWLTDVVAERVEGITKRLEAGEPVDLYTDLAADLPLLALARLTELPAAEAGTVKEFSRAALELFWAPVDEQRQQHLAGIVSRFYRVLQDFSKDAPGTLGELRDYTATNGLHRDTPVAALFFLLVAGQETTSQFLTLLMHRLAAQPSLLDHRVADIVEEGLRLVPPIPTWRRVAAREVVLGGHRVPEGRSIVLWLARAGRDIAGADFVPGKTGSRKHLAFGAGAHRCIGAQLSRMEAAVVVEQIAPILRRVSILREPRCPDNLSFRMPDSFVVSLRQEPVGRP